MAERAHVTSIEALESFRTSLILYLSKARPALEEISSDIVRNRLWLQTDQRMHWETQFRRREKELQQAEQALSSARMSAFRQDKSTEQNAVRKAKRALEEAEGKLKMLKHWNREFDSRVGPLAKQLDKLHTVLTTDMVEAAAYLSRAIDTLSAYAEIGPPPDSPPASVSGEGEGAKADLPAVAGDSAAISEPDGGEPKGSKS